MWFLEIFDESQKFSQCMFSSAMAFFSILHTVEAKAPNVFPLKSSNLELFSRLTFVAYGIMMITTSHYNN